MGAASSSVLSYELNSRGNHSAARQRMEKMLERGSEMGGGEASDGFQVLSLVVLTFSQPRAHCYDNKFLSLLKPVRAAVRES